MDLIILAVIALVNGFVGACDLNKCIPMATTRVIIHWGPCYAGGGETVAAKKMDAWPRWGRCRGRAEQAVCKFKTRVCRG